jgi:hypothetical protein
MRSQSSRTISLASYASVLLLLVGSFFLHDYLAPASLGESSYEHEEEYEATGERKSGELEKVEMKKDRSDYFFTLMRDPATNSIPTGIRSKELELAKTLPKRSQMKARAATQFTWSEIGPNNIGGRTRALAVDMDDANTIIAGGVSGGIWKSTDNGDSWTLETDPNQNYSVTSLVQDPTSTNHDTWYYATGEYLGNSASARGANYYGTGIYKSTDNGDSWTRVVGDSDNSFNSQYDFISRIIVSPTTGSVFFAASPFGVFKLNSDNTSDLLIGAANDHTFADVAVGSDGRLVAVLSEYGFNSTNPDKGVWVSNDDGSTWSDITPSTFPSSYERSVVTIAPSDPSIAYIMTYTGSNQADNASYEDVRLHKLDLDAGTSDDRSDNLPYYSGNGDLNTQGGYNMVIAVKPDDPNFLLIGGTNLYRSDDAFNTAEDASYSWIGGYGQTSFQYPNHHPDNHSLAFSPDDPGALWSGHDGGLSYVGDITSSSIFWNDRNNGYNVTQFYAVAIPENEGDDRIMGGAQDNGSPYMTINNSGTSSGEDLSTGDGSYAYFGQNHAYVSTQRGNVRRLDYETSGDPVNIWTTGQYSKSASVSPDNASGQLFINPFVVDPADENYMYYPAGSSLWRHPAIDADSYDGTKWSQLTSNTLSGGYVYSNMAASKNNPSHVLYLAAYSSNGIPKILRLSNSTTSTQAATDVSSAQWPSGAYIHRLAVNPADGDEVIVVMSNYGITGVYHTTNGGTSWTAIEGNLEGTTNDPGPSIRDAAILPTQNGNVYLLGTSIGLYSTTTLSGSTTQWMQEAENEIGYAITEDIAARPSDGFVAAATHGRGIFGGQLATFTDIADSQPNESPSKMDLAQNYPNPFNPSTQIQFSLNERSTIQLKVFDIQGREVARLIGNETRTAGQYSVPFNAASLASGNYIYQLRIQPASSNSPTVLTRQMTLLK